MCSLLKFSTVSIYCAVRGFAPYKTTKIGRNIFCKQIRFIHRSPTCTYNMFTFIKMTPQLSGRSKTANTVAQLLLCVSRHTKRNKLIWKQNSFRQVSTRIAYIVVTEISYDLLLSMLSASCKKCGIIGANVTISHSVKNKRIPHQNETAWIKTSLTKTELQTAMIYIFMFADTS